MLGGPVAVTAADRYEELLAAQKVIVSQTERRRLIVEGLDACAEESGGAWSDPGDVLAEAVFLTEWPSVARGEFAERHLRLPDEVLVTAMQSHQRYFPVRSADGDLLPAFLYVSNGDPAAAALVTRGNERVLDGRLDDAEFAYDRDIAEGLDTMADRLGSVVFHEKLGSLADKAQRLGGLVAGLAAGPGASGAAAGGNGSAAPLAETARVAARLAKADLVSQVVIEFPVLQGVMGGLYADAGGLGRRGRSRRGRAPPAAVRHSTAPQHRRRGPAGDRRQGRQHRRRLGRRPEAVRVTRSLRLAPRRDGHRAHRARVRPAVLPRRLPRLRGGPVRTPGHRGA